MEMLANTTLVKKIVRVRDKNQITLPSVVIAGMPIRPGDFVELTRTANGVLEIRPISLIPLANTPDADASIAEAERDMAKGDYKTFSAGQYADALRSRKKKDEKVARASAQAAR